MSRFIRWYVRSFQGLPASTWWLALALLIHRSGTMVLPFLTLYITSKLGFSVNAAVAYVAWYGIGSILGSLVGGRLIGRYGAIPVMMFSFTFSGVALLGVSLARGPWWLAIAVFALSVIAEMSRPASATAATNFCPEVDHPRALALNRLAINLGMTCGPAAAGFLAKIGYHWLFIVDAATCWLAVGVLAWHFDGRRRMPENGVHASHQETNEGTAATRRIRSPWRDRAFLGIAIMTILQGMIFFQLLCTYPMYLKQVYHFSEPDIGLVFALNTLCVVLFEMILINFISNFSQLNVIAWGNFFIFLGFGVLPLGNGWPMASCSVLIWTLGEMLSMPVSAAYVSRLARDGEERGRYFGAFTSCYSVSFVFAPLVGGMLYAWSPSAVWWISLAISPLVFLGIRAFDRAEARPINEPAPNQASGVA